MGIHNDLTFFTNEPERNLYDRFNKILQSNTQFYDMLVGYFRTSGFYLMYPSMEDVEKVRVLVGLNVDGKTVQIIEKAKEEQMSFEMSHKEVRDEFSDDVAEEMQNSEDSYRVEQGVKTFIKWLQAGKLEMRVYPEAPIHAKVYIIRKNMEKVPDQYGTVITGSSNFSKAGLVNNLEFNVELKDSRDVEFALNKFEELWERSIDISDEYVEAVNGKTWIRGDITPYELFLKTLYEYFKEEINEDKNETWEEILPDGYMKLQYQTDAVVQAKKILKAYNGVFIADVVGLGKTFICAMLAQRLKGRKLIICPPVLKEYWERTLQQFEVSAKVESLGKLDSILEDEDLMKNMKYVFIDEAHRFRNQKTESFQKLHEICYNKKVILITATPQNNYSSDIANQIYLFQPKNNSTIIPNNKNIEAFFNRLDSKLKKLDKGTEEYSETLKANSEIIRDQVLRNVMIRRTRNEIMECYKEDLEKQGLKFPELGDPEKIVYTYDDDIEAVFNHTMESIKNLTYARYKPLTYLGNVPKEIASLLVSQRNMSGFMKTILVKRLESSFEAFKKTLHRFIKSYEKFLKMCLDGEVYISKKVDVYDLLDNGDDERLMGLVEENIVQYYPIKAFKKEFIPSIKYDLNILRELESEWEEIIEDPKKEQFLLELKTNEKIKDKKVIIFTESKETAEYVGEYLEKYYPEKVLIFSGQGSRAIRQEIEANYNPNFAYEKKNDIQFLVTTDVLAEGINLHRSNVIINYDLPWNPTKIMQRVGRINRVGTEYDKIYVFNFFPTAQANAELPLEENIILKIQAFHDTLGEDFKYLSEDEEVSSHNLYKKLNSKDILEAEENDDVYELKYLKIIREVRDNDENLYEKIKKLPQKSKSGRILNGISEDKTVTFLKKGALKKFFIADIKDSEEISFLQAMKYLEVEPNEKKVKTPKTYFEHLELNKLGFEISLTEEEEIITEKASKAGNDAKVIRLLKTISRCKAFTDEQDILIKKLRNIWEEGNVPAGISKEVLKQTKGMNDSVKVFYEIQEIVPKKYFEERKGKKKVNLSGNMKVILSSYLKKGDIE
ncbi:helicase-related protein [Haloimpatiens lingqiaonensis]|uniref:helicase-related protein n=1 Tax=Haloimpatiens lingqiaonensis TaxID=1380675 RepID=UPI0010FF5F2E|nr:helicase-related protein [Haloimpatiens lingqiaonensis]